MKTVKFIYGGSMVPDWEIFETNANLSDLLTFAFDLQKYNYINDSKSVEEIYKNFSAKHHYKSLTGSEDWTGNIKTKVDLEIDLDDFIEILEEYTINFNF